MEREPLYCLSSEDEEEDFAENKANLLKELLRFGFTPQVAAEICQSIPDKWVSHQCPSYWAMRHIDYIAGLVGD